MGAATMALVESELVSVHLLAQAAGIVAQGNYLLHHLTGRILDTRCLRTMG